MMESLYGYLKDGEQRVVFWRTDKPVAVPTEADCTKIDLARRDVEELLRTMDGSYDLGAEVKPIPNA